MNNSSEEKLLAYIYKCGKTHEGEYVAGLGDWDGTMRCPCGVVMELTTEYEFANLIEE